MGVFVGLSVLFFSKSCLGGRVGYTAPQVNGFRKQYLRHFTVVACMHLGRRAPPFFPLKPVSWVGYTVELLERGAQEENWCTSTPIVCVLA